jgi:hypothetical protein
MNSQTSADAEALGKAVYCFLKVQINLEADKADVFTSDGKLDAQSISYPTVWHEYTHYLQNVATTIGTRIFLNWVAVLVNFSDTVMQRNPLRVPLYRDTNPVFSRYLNSFLEEVGKLMGLKAALDTSPPAQAHAFSPYLDQRDTTHALLCIERGGRRVGVPLYGNAFVEAMAQSVQWLVQYGGKWDGSPLQKCNYDTTQAYYYALIQYFASHCPAINPCIPTVLVSFAALQTTQPAAFFYEFHSANGIELVRSGNWKQLSIYLKSLPMVRNGIATGVSELERLETNNVSNAENTFFKMVLALTCLMKRNLNAYVQEPDFVEYLLNPTSNGLSELSKQFYFPPMYTCDIKKGWSLNLPETFHRLFALSFALYTLVLDINNTSMQHECQLLRKQYCVFAKDKKEYCHMHRLNFKEYEGKICSMGEAARLLGLYQRPMIHA